MVAPAQCTSDLGCTFKHLISVAHCAHKKENIAKITNQNTSSKQRIELISKSGHCCSFTSINAFIILLFSYIFRAY